MKKLISLSVLILLLAACKSETKETSGEVQVDSLTIGRNIHKMASDDFQGRKPFTEGEEKTTAYLKEQFSKLGLEPGDNYFQKVPMVSITGTPSEKMKISGKGKNIELQYFDDFVR